MDKVPPGSPNVNNWKDEFFVLRTFLTDSGPASRVVEFGFAHFRRRSLAWCGSSLLRRPTGVDFSEPWVSTRLDSFGVKVEDLQVAPPFEDVLRDHLSAVSCPVWVGYHIRSDFKALARERSIAEDRLGRSLSSLVPRPSIQVQVSDLAGKLHPLIGQSLYDMCSRYEVDLETVTQGMAVATGEVLVAMMDRLPDKPSALRQYLAQAEAESKRVKARYGARRW